LDSILENSTEKQRINQFHLIFGILFTLFLSGCYQTKPLEISYNIDLKHAWLEEYPITQNLSLNQYELTSIDSSNAFKFENNKKLLLKINFNQIAFSPKNKEFILTVSPSSLQEVTYFQSEVADNEAQLITTQKKYSGDINSNLSAQQFAFNIDNEDLFKSHYLLINSHTPVHIELILNEHQRFIQNEIRNNQQSTFLLTLIFAVALYCLLNYFHKQDKAFFLLSFYGVTTLLALLWQSKMINYLPWLLWPLLDSHSVLFYELLACVSAFALVYHLTHPLRTKKWLIQLFILFAILQLGLLFYASFPDLQSPTLGYPAINQGFNILLLFMYVTLTVILLISQSKLIRQPKQFIIAWIIVLVGLVIHKYHVTFPGSDFSRLEHLHEATVLAGFLILSIAVSSKQRLTENNQQISKEPNTKEHNKSIFKHQLLSQFQNQMQKLADNTTLSEDEIEEKTHIKFHLLLTQAYPIKNSLILTGKEIEGICTTGINTPDIDFLRQLAMELSEKETSDECMQKLIGMAGEKQSNVLFVPLKKADGKKVVFILTLKTDVSLKSQTLKEIKSFCEDAYTELCQAKTNFQTVMATKLDSLTHCYNRESIQTIIKHSLDQRKITTIAYIKLDNLVIDSEDQGKFTTNQLVVDFAQILKDQLANKVKIGRISSDEFLVVFTGFDINTCLEKLESLYQQLNKRNNTAEIKISCSTGLAESRMNETIRSLTKKAKLAMLQAQKEGGNQVIMYAVDMTDTD
jgi:diguanylate cyclase (GGDEF)-like protein